ncbi:MAG TPA: hypothetical protein DDX14_07175, partial [Cyanobacteria bacterium UBA9579]|nr:hypothetical protein [Cyanobacteria bacterium UBA9579]
GLRRASPSAATLSINLIYFKFHLVDSASLDKLYTLNVKINYIFGQGLNEYFLFLSINTF